MIVSDSTTLIILFDLKRVDLLENLFKRVLIPQRVYEEVSLKRSVRLPDFMEVVIVQESDTLDTLQLLLDEGESEAIALAKLMNLPIIIDEKKGRKIAKNLDLKVIGLLGVIYLNVKKGFMSFEDAEAFLQKIVNHGYRIKAKLVDDLLASLE